MLATMMTSSSYNSNSAKKLSKAAGPSGSARGRMSPFSALPPIKSQNSSSGGTRNNANNTFGAEVHTLNGPMTGSSSSVADITRSSGRSPAVKPKLPITGPGKSLKASSRSSLPQKPLNTQNLTRITASGDQRHLGFLNKPNISTASAKSVNNSKAEVDSATTTEITKSTQDIDLNKKTARSEKIKVCVKLPNSTREVLTVSPTTTFQQILTLIQKKRKFKEPEFITSDIPARRISGNKLALTLLDFGIENNSVLHCDDKL